MCDWGWLYSKTKIIPRSKNKDYLILSSQALIGRIKFPITCEVNDKSSSTTKKKKNNKISVCQVTRLNKCRRLYIYWGIWAGLTFIYFALCSLIWSSELTLSIIKVTEKYSFILWSMTKAVSYLIGRFGFWFPCESFPCLSFPFTCF